MDKQAYNECMKPWISGKHEDRKLDFCVGAKICSGKAATPDEAKKVCLLPKPPGTTSTGRRRRGLDAGALAACVLGKITDCEGLDAPTLAGYIAACSGGKVKKPETGRTWMRKCVAEKTVTGTFLESNKNRQECVREWKAKEAGGQSVPAV